MISAKEAFFDSLYYSSVSQEAINVLNNIEKYIRSTCQEGKRSLYYALPVYICEEDNAENQIIDILKEYGYIVYSENCGYTVLKIEW